MSNRTDKFADKAKTPTMVIDGEKGIVPDSAEWHFYFHKRKFFDFLFDLQIKISVGSFRWLTRVTHKQS